jgi:hypothetical protein
MHVRLQRHLRSEKPLRLCSNNHCAYMAQIPGVSDRMTRRNDVSQQIEQQQQQQWEQRQDDAPEVQPQEPAAGTPDEDDDQDEGHEAADDAPEVQEQEPKERVRAPAARWIGAGAATTAESAGAGAGRPAAGAGAGVGGANGEVVIAEEEARCIGAGAATTAEAAGAGAGRRAAVEEAGAGGTTVGEGAAAAAARRNSAGAARAAEAGGRRRESRRSPCVRCDEYDRQAQVRLAVPALPQSQVPSCRCYLPDKVSAAHHHTPCAQGTRSVQLLRSLSAQQAQRDLDAYWGKESHKYTAAAVYVRAMIRGPLVGSRGRWPCIEK